MASKGRRKCKCCQQLFRPDPRNRHHQRYCPALACRAASKAASQARWRASPENQDYFRGAVAVARVRAWRSRHPGYCSPAATQRYKMSCRVNPLTQRAKQPIPRGRRYKRSYRRNRMF
jgi:hypothetical protein